MKQSRTAFSRRRFLGGAAAAVAAPLIIPRSVLGDETTPGANEKLAIGCVGIGKMMYGDHLPHYLRMNNVKIVAVCDVDTTRREAGKKRADDAYGNSDCAAYINYHDILERDDIDAVACATPDHWHAMVILDTCKAGKDMYCEKPLTNNLVEAKKVMDAVNASDIIFQTGSQQRASDNFRYACELVRNGYIGKVQQVQVGVGGPPRPCDLPGEEMEPGLDWERWLGPAPMREYSSVLSPRGVHNHFPSWRNYCEYGGGGMTDWGAHHVDIATWGMDKTTTGPISVDPVLAEHPVPFENGYPTVKDRYNTATKFDIKVTYADGIELSILSGARNGILFEGTEGRIFVSRGVLQGKPVEDLADNPLPEGLLEEVYKGGPIYDGMPGFKSNPHVKNFFNAIDKRTEPISDVFSHHRALTTCHLSGIAARLGRKIQWNPETETVVDDAQAQALTAREKRQGFEIEMG